MGKSPNMFQGHVHPLKFYVLRPLNSLGFVNHVLPKDIGCTIHIEYTYLTHIAQEEIPLFQMCIGCFQVP